MATSFLNLCNAVLRRLNEVEMEAVDFDTARGVQALVKDAVQNSIYRINQAEFFWPFNAAESATVLTVGQQDYDFPSDFKVVEWNSFQLQKNDALGVDYTGLDFISRDDWYDKLRDLDFSAGGTGRDVPSAVFPGTTGGFGVSPSPNKNYTVRYRYYRGATALVNSSDVTRIPSTYDYVIVEGALHNMYMYRDNPESAQLSLNYFEQGIKEMQTLLINQYDRITDRRINFGGNKVTTTVLV